MHFQQTQQAFIAHIKDPQQPLPAGIEERRMAVYRELFFSNVQSFVSTALPVLQSLYDESAWQQLIRQFFRAYPCSSPYFLHIARHFVDFLQQDYQLQPHDPVFMRELAHYEWAELYLATTPQTGEETAVRAEQIGTSTLQLSQLSMLLAYPYAVHQISTNYQPAQASEMQYYLLYRNTADDVKFVLVNQLTAALLQILQQAPGSTLAQLVQQMQILMPTFNTAQLQQGASSILQDFARKGVVVSFQAEQNSLP